MSEDSGFNYFDAVYFDITEFLVEYEKLPCLWDKGHKHFKDRRERLKAEESLGEKLNIIDLKTLRRKIRSVRGTYNTEIRKFKTSLDNDAELYVTKLSWFPLADTFLRVTTDVPPDIIIPVESGALLVQKKTVLQKLPRQKGLTVVMVRTPKDKDKNAVAAKENPMEYDEENTDGLEDEAFEELEILDVDDLENFGQSKDQTDDEPLASVFDCSANISITKQQRRERSSTPDYAPSRKRAKRAHKLATRKNKPNKQSLVDVVRSLKDICRATENEFSAFGRSVGVQLQKMPVEIAIQLQTDIQAHITRTRLDYLQKGNYEQ